MRKQFSGKGRGQENIFYLAVRFLGAETVPKKTKQGCQRVKCPNYSLIREQNRPIICSNPFWVVSRKILDFNCQLDNILIFNGSLLKYTGVGIKGLELNDP